MLILILLLFQLACSASNDFRRLAKPVINYRYFVEESGDSFKILGSCLPVKSTSPRSRCILRIDHKYLAIFTSGFSQKVMGTGIIIQKLINDNIRSITVLTAYHVIIPQSELNFGSYICLFLFIMIFIVLLPLIIYIPKIDPRYLKKLFLVLACYCIVCCGLLYCFILSIYPFLFNSSFRLNFLLGDNNRFTTELSNIQCKIISSSMMFSGDWWDDLGLIQCSNVEEHLFAYLEVCKPKLNNTVPMSSSLPINVLGFVGRTPEAFDLVVHPYFSAYLPLVTIESIDGKKPENLLSKYQFMNCTGILRLTDRRTLYIDTPATYGFSGGPCFVSTHADEWEFIGVLTGASRLWNKCTLLQQSPVFNSYYNDLIEQEQKQNNQHSKTEF